MAKKFLFEDEPKPSEPKLTYGDGFRLGFGMLIAWLLGILVISGVAALVTQLLRR